MDIDCTSMSGQRRSIHGDVHDCPKFLCLALARQGSDSNLWGARQYRRCWTQTSIHRPVCTVRCSDAPIRRHRWTIGSCEKGRSISEWSHREWLNQCRGCMQLTYKRYSMELVGFYLYRWRAYTALIPILPPPILPLDHALFHLRTHPLSSQNYQRSSSFWNRSRSRAHMSRASRP